MDMLTKAVGTCVPEIETRSVSFDCFMCGFRIDALMNFAVGHHGNVTANGREGNRLPEHLHPEVESGAGRTPSEEDDQGRGIEILLKLVHALLVMLLKVTFQRLLATGWLLSAVNERFAGRRFSSLRL